MATWRINNSTLLGGEYIAIWQANHTYAVGARCLGVEYGNSWPTTAYRVYECTTGGLTGGAEPTWNTTLGATTTDNAAVWTTRSPTDGNWDNATTMRGITYHPYGFTAGDTVLIANTHNELFTVSWNLSISVSPVNPYKWYSVDKATDIPTKGAVLRTNSNKYIYLTGDLYSYGIRYESGATIGLQVAGYVNARMVFEMPSPSDVVFKIGVDSENGQFFAGNDYGSSVHVRNASIELVRASGRFQSGPGFLTWDNGTLICTAGRINFFISNFRGGLRCTGVDLSQICPGASTSYFFQTTGVDGEMIFNRCKLPSGSGFGWIDSGAYAFGGAIHAYHQARLYHCANDNTSYRYRLMDLNGIAVDEETFVRTGGANDGVTSFSCKMVSSTRTNDRFYNQGLYSIPIVGLLNGDASQTVTVECLVDSATALQNDEVWLELDYPADGTSGLGVVGDNRCTIIGTPADVTTSAASWYTTGMSNPRPFKLAITFDPGKKGPIEARVVLAKKSTTIYVDPLITIS